MQFCDFEITADIQFCQQNIIKIWSKHDQKRINRSWILWILY